MIGDYVTGRCTRKIFTKTHPDGIYPEVSGVLIKDHGDGTTTVEMLGGTVKCFGPKELKIVDDENLSRSAAMLALRERRKIIKRLLRKASR